MTRTIPDHKVNPSNNTLTITVLDKPGRSGAHLAMNGSDHQHEGQWLDDEGNPFFTGDRATEWCAERLIVFQDGPIGEAGVNGVTYEALLAILIDRMRCFQSGPFACRENEQALKKLEEALNWLHCRTLARMVRTVEETHTA